MALVFSAGLASAQFETRSSIKVDGNVTAIAAGDFNKDGKLDIAIATGGNIQILLGKGDGTFQAPIVYSSNSDPRSIVAADLNHDGKLDLVVGNVEFTVSVLLGNGDGTFQPAQDYPIPSNANSVAVGDMNNDKIPDIVVANAPHVSVMLGNGDGTFQAPIDNQTFPTFVPSIALADFNGDGNLDVAAAGPNTGVQAIGILFGNGDGSLQTAISHPTNVSAESLVAADFNNDGKADIAFGGGGLGVLLGNGDGSFRAEVDYAGAGGEVIVGDLNGDGKKDIVAPTPDRTRFEGADVYLGNGDGTFHTVQVYPAGAEPAYAAIGDFNGDGKQDLEVLDEFRNQATVLLNTGVVAFSPTTPLSFGKQAVGTTSQPQTVTLTNTGKSTLTIFSMKTTGQFAMTSTCGSSVPAGGNCSISATFSPTSTGLKSGTVTINDSDSSKPQVIELSGTGD